MRAMRARGDVIPNKIDGFGFATSYKSVLLEGLEVAFIVISMGASAAKAEQDKGNTLLAAALGAAAAGILVIAVGAVVRGPLTKVPENTLKFVVGIMLTSFGIFWAGEGLGVTWPLEDAFILVLIVANLLLTGALVAWLKPHGDAKKVQKATTNLAYETANDPVKPLRKEELH